MPPRKNTQPVNIVGSVPCSSETQNQSQTYQVDPILQDHPQAAESSSGSRKQPSFFQEAGRRRSLRNNHLEPFGIEQETQGNSRGRKRPRDQLEIEVLELGTGELVHSPISEDPLALPLSPDILTPSANAPSIRPLRPAPRTSLRQQNLPAEEINLPPHKSRRSFTSDPLPLTREEVKAEFSVEPTTEEAAFPAPPVLPHRRLSLRQQNIPAEAQELQPTRFTRRSIPTVPLPSPLVLPVTSAEPLVESPVDPVERRRSSRQQNLPAEPVKVEPHKRRKSTVEQPLQVETAQRARDEPINQSPERFSESDDSAVPSSTELLDTQHRSTLEPESQLVVDHSLWTELGEPVRRPFVNPRTYSNRRNTRPSGEPSGPREPRRSSRFHPAPDETSLSGHLSEPIEQQLEPESGSTSVPVEALPVEPTSRRRSSRFNTTDDLYLAPPLLVEGLQPVEPSQNPSRGRQRRYTSPIKTRRSSRLSSTAETPLLTPDLSIGGVDGSTDDETAIKWDEDQLDGDLEPELEPKLPEQKVPPDILLEPDPESPDPLDSISRAATPSPLALQPRVSESYLDPEPLAPKDPFEAFTPVPPSSPLSVPPDPESELRDDLIDATELPGHRGTPQLEEEDFVLPPSLIEESKRPRDLQAFSSSLTELPLSAAQSSAGIVDDDPVNQPEDRGQLIVQGSHTPSVPISALVDDGHIDQTQPFLEPTSPVDSPAEPAPFTETDDFAAVDPAGPIPPQPDTPEPVEEDLTRPFESEQAPVHSPRLPADHSTHLLSSQENLADRVDVEDATQPKPTADIDLEGPGVASSKREVHDSPSVPLGHPSSNQEKQQATLVSPPSRNESAPGSPETFLVDQLLNFARTEVVNPVRDIPSGDLELVADHRTPSTDPLAPASQEDHPGSSTFNRVVLVVAPALSPIPEASLSQAVEISNPGGETATPSVGTPQHRLSEVVPPDPATPDTARRSALRLARVDTWSPEARIIQPAISEPQSGLQLDRGSPIRLSRASPTPPGSVNLGSWSSHADSISHQIPARRTSIRLLLNNIDRAPIATPPAAPPDLDPIEQNIPLISIIGPEDSSFDQSEQSIREDRLLPPDIDMSDTSSDLSAAPNSPNSPKKMKRNDPATEAGPSGSTSGETKGNGKKRKATTSAEDAIGDVDADSRTRKSPRKRSKDNTPSEDVPPPAVKSLKLKFNTGKTSASPQKLDSPLPPTTDPPVEVDQPKPTKKKRQSPSAPSAPTSATRPPAALSHAEGQTAVQPSKTKSKDKKKSKVVAPPTSLDVPQVDSGNAGNIASSQSETVVASSSQPLALASATPRSSQQLKKKRRKVVESDGEDEDEKDARGKGGDGMDVDPPEGHPGGLTPPAMTEEVGDESAQAKGKKKRSTEAEAAVGVEPKRDAIRGNQSGAVPTPGGKNAPASVGQAMGSGGQSKKKGKDKSKSKDGGKSKPVPDTGSAPTAPDAAPGTALEATPAAPLDREAFSSTDKLPADGSKAKEQSKKAVRQDAAPPRPIQPERKGKTATPQPVPGSKEKPVKEGQGTTPRPSGSGKDLPALTKIQKKDSGDPSVSKKDKGDGTPSIPAQSTPRPDAVDKSAQKKTATAQVKKNPIGPATSFSLLQQTLASLQGGGSTPKRESTEKSAKKTVERPKPSTYQWGVDYKPDAEQRAQIEATRPQREAEREIRRQWRKNAINLQEPKDAYREDALRVPELKLAHPMGVLPIPGQGIADIIRGLWAEQDAEAEAGLKAEGPEGNEQSAANGSVVS